MMVKKEEDQQIKGSVSQKKKKHLKRQGKSRKFFRLEKYFVTELLGEGDSGKVYAATDTQTGEEVVS